MTEFLHPPDTLYQPSPSELIELATGMGVVCDDAGLVTLEGGYHNAVYRYGDVVIRHPRTAEGTDTLRSEYELLVDMNGCRMPRALGYTTIGKTPVVLMEFVDGEHRDFNALTPLEIKELARAMHELHEVTDDRFSVVAGAKPTRRGTHADYIYAMVRESVIDRLAALQKTGNELSLCDEVSRVIETGLQKLDAILVDSSDKFSETTFCLLHHDLNPENVMWRSDGNVVFIDPNPTYGDPLDDVNFAIVNNQGSSNFEAELLEAYSYIAQRGTISPEQMEVYTLKNWLDDLVWTIAMGQQHEGDPDREMCEKYGKLYMARLTALQQLLGVE